MGHYHSALQKTSLLIHVAKDTPCQPAYSQGLIRALKVHERHHWIQGYPDAGHFSVQMLWQIFAIACCKPPNTDFLVINFSSVLYKAVYVHLDDLHMMSNSKFRWAVPWGDRSCFQKHSILLSVLLTTLCTS